MLTDRQTDNRFVTIHDLDAQVAGRTFADRRDNERHVALLLDEARSGRVPYPRKVSNG